MLLFASSCLAGFILLQNSVVLCDDDDDDSGDYHPLLEDTDTHPSALLPRRRSNDAGCGGAREIEYLYFISSPNFPLAYGNYESCIWRLAGPAGHTIRIIFTDFNVEEHRECGFDSVEIYDGASELSDPLGKFCGTDLPPPIESTTNEVLVRFVTDESNTNSGFRFHYELTCACGNSSLCYFDPRKDACICDDGYAEKNGKCEECSCGNNSPCIFENGEKVCICKTGFAQKDGRCEECFCGNNFPCTFDGGEKVCFCSPGYIQKDGRCEECSCGDNSSCIFEAGEKVCICKRGFMQKEGRCEECYCGGNYPCVFEGRKKTCLCPEQHVEHDGECQECYCGDKQDCKMVSGEKVCYCMEPYKDNNGTCEECYCESGPFCEFHNGRKICAVSQNLQEDKEPSKGFVSLIILLGILSAVLLLGSIYGAICYTRLKKRFEKYSASHPEADNSISSRSTIPYEKESLM